MKQSLYAWMSSLFRKAHQFSPKFIVYFFIIPSITLPQFAWAASGGGGDEPPLRRAVSVTSDASSTWCSRRAGAGCSRFMAMLGWGTAPAPLSTIAPATGPGTDGLTGVTAVRVNPLLATASTSTSTSTPVPVRRVLDSVADLGREFQRGSGRDTDSKAGATDARASFAPGAVINSMRPVRRSRFSHVVPNEASREESKGVGATVIVPLEMVPADDVSSTTGSGGSSPGSSSSEITPPRGRSDAAVGRPKDLSGAGTGLSAAVVVNPLRITSVREGEAGDSKTTPHTAIAVDAEGVGRSKDGMVGGKTIAVAGEEGGEDPIGRTPGAVEEELTEADKAALRRFNDYLQNRLGLLSEGWTAGDLIRAGLMIVATGLLAPAVRAMWALVIGKTTDTLQVSSEEMSAKLLYTDAGWDFINKFGTTIISNVGIFWSPLILATVWGICQRFTEVYEQWTIQKQVPWYVYGVGTFIGLINALVQAVPATMMLYDQRHLKDSEVIGTTYVWWGLVLFTLVPVLRAWGAFKDKALPTYINRGSKVAWKRQALGLHLLEAQRTLYAMKGPDLRPIYDEQARLRTMHPTLMQWLRFKPYTSARDSTAERHRAPVFSVASSDLTELKGLKQLGKLMVQNDEPKEQERPIRHNTLKQYGHRMCIGFLLLFAALSAFALGMGNYFSIEKGLISTFSAMAGHPDDSAHFKNMRYQAMAYENQQRQIWESEMAGSPVIYNGGWNGTDWCSDLWDDRKIRYAGTSEWVDPPVEEEYPVEGSESDDDSHTSSTTTTTHTTDDNTNSSSFTDDNSHNDTDDNTSGSDDDHGWVRDVRFNVRGLPSNILFGYSEGDFVKDAYNCWGWYDFIAARYTPGFLRDEALKVLAPELLDPNRVEYELPKGGKVTASIFASLAAVGMMAGGGWLLKNYLRRLKDGFSLYPEEVKPGKYYRVINGINIGISTIQGAVWSLPLAFFGYSILVDRVPANLLFPFLALAIVPLTAGASESFDDAYTSMVRWGKNAIYGIMRLCGRTYVPKWIVRDGLLIATIDLKNAIQIADDRIIEALWKKFKDVVDPKFIDLSKNPPPSQLQKILVFFKRKPKLVS